MLPIAMSCGKSSPEPEPEPRSAPAEDPEPPAEVAPKEPPKALEEPPPAEPPSPPPIDPWPSLSLPAAPPMTPDGLPILEVSMPEGSRWDVTPAWHTLTYAQQQASDGISTFVAVRNDEGMWSDVVIRGGEVRTNALRRLAETATHPRGCGFAREGTLLMSAPIPAEKPGEASTQGVWVVKTDGSIVRHTLPADAGSSPDCKGVLDGPERFSLFVGPLVEHGEDGFRIDREWDASRTFLTEPMGPRYCFRNCNEQEQAATPAPLVAALEEVSKGCATRYAVYGDLVVARCNKTNTVVRVHVSSGEVETLTGVPKSAVPSDGVQITRDGHVVIELAVHMSRYMVWPASSDTPSPWRSRELSEVIVKTSPTVLIRGLPEPMPRVEVSAVLLGATLPFDEQRGLSRADHVLDRGSSALHARSDRATAVLPSGPVVIAHEAAVHLGCGAYVRAPVGWEGEPPAHDFDPPVIPPVDPKAVHTPSPCRPLTEVHALPGNPDFLLALTEDGQLATGWLPPPLPLPSTYRRGHMAPPPTTAGLPGVPQPGPGWVLHGSVDSIEGLRALRAPGTQAKPMAGWHKGGAAVLKADGATIVVAPQGAWTVPDGTKPMALQMGPSPRLYGSLGPKLVVCDERCRTVDPGDGRDIVGVMPRTQGEVILGFGEQRDETAVYRVPSKGGTATPVHALEVSLSGELKAQPKSPE